LKSAVIVIKDFQKKMP